MENQFCFRYCIYCAHCVSSKSGIITTIKCDAKLKEECPFEFKDVIENKNIKVRFSEK